MTKTLAQLIADAQKALDATQEGSEDRKLAQAKLDALKAVEQEGITKTQDDLNRIDKQSKEAERNAWKEALFGMDLEDVKEAVASFTPEVEGGKGSDGDDDANPLKRMQSALAERDSKIEELSNQTTGLSRSLYSERVENNLRRAFSGLEVGEGDSKSKVALKNGRFDFVRGLAGEQELVEKLMNGEPLPEGVYAERVKAVYQNLPEVFDSGNGDSQHDPGVKTVAGVKVRLDQPGIPATPIGGSTTPITDEDRAKRATSIY